MVPNPGRWLLFTLGLIVLSVVLVFTKGINFGSDLKGGTRLAYSVPFDEARKSGQLTAEENRAEILNKTIDVMRKRVDGLGLREINISGQGDDQFVIELPGLSELEIENIKTTVTSLGKLEFRIVASDADGFDLTREQKKLHDYFDTTEIKKRVEAWKEREAAKHASDPRDLSVWIDILRSYHSVAGSNGPVKGLRWYPRSEPKGITLSGDERKREPIFVPMRIEEDLDKRDGAKFVFRGDDLSTVGPTTTEKGRAVFFRFSAEKRSAFGEFTEKYVKRDLAIILNDFVDTTPIIENELPGEGVIQSGQVGGYQPEELRALITVLETGSLRIKPRLESESRIGSSLGEDSIRLGIWSSVLALAVTFTFMLVYYRLAGTIAAVSLIVNGIILLGVLSLYNATLTLPGIAGFILTLAMAVDSNILIYERIREEGDRGRGVEQAVRLGFERAFVTIVDSNLTTLLTSLVLYYVGTGPIKGLGITLSIGILTTLFAALVFTKAIFAFLLDKKMLPAVRMMRLFKKTPNLRFMEIWKMTVAISVLTSIAGLVAFGLAPSQVFGVDFVGGATARVKLEKPVEVQEMRNLLADKVPGFDSMEATPAVNSFSVVPGEAGYREYMVKGKLSKEQRSALNKEEEPGAGTNNVERFRSGLTKALGSRIVPSGVANIKIDKAADGSMNVSFVVNLVSSGTFAEVKDLLSASAVGLTGVEVAENPMGASAAVKASYTVSGKAAAGFSEDNVRQGVARAFDAARDKFTLTDPFPEANTILPRVAKSLKNKAILSLLASFGLIILYVRFRFQEYRYGIGGVIGIVHDLVVTLGCVALANTFGLVDVEIDMTMIAVFLTIAGYSINDTIVIFDRIRENLADPEIGKDSLEKVIDDSCNQTLSRTLLTSTAAFLASALMFILNRGRHNPLEGFGFTMMVGIVSGTYSSIWVASLFVVAIERWNQRMGHAPRPRKSAELVATKE